MATRRLDHVSVRIADLPRARAFYEDVLGLERAPRPELGVAGVWYGLGAGQLHLIQAPKMTDDIDPTGPHFAVEVESLAEARRTLEARGLPYLDFGGTQLWVRDPDGNVVELCERARGA